MWLDPLSHRLFKNAGTIPAGQGRGPVVLMYHSIEPGAKTPRSMWAVSARDFAAQMDLLKAHGWQTFLFRDLLAADELPPKSVVITFDDGYADNFENGFKVLQARGMRATWFVATAHIDGRASWPGGNDQPMLSRREICEMHESGMEMGAHTRTHCALPDVAPSLIWDEIHGSKVDLEDMIGGPVTSFAYPYGRYDQNALDVVKKAGFAIACSTETGWFGGQKDLFKVPRISVYSGVSLSNFARTMAFCDPSIGFEKIIAYCLRRIKNNFWQGKPKK